MICRRLLMLAIITVIMYILVSEVGLALEPPIEEWNVTFGGTGIDRAHSVQETDDGGYIFAGGTGPLGSKTWNTWLVKTDSNGNKQWENTFGGTGIDVAYSVQQTTDGGYILAGGTRSFGSGAWLVKVDSNGNEMWNKTFEGTGNDIAYSVQQTTDGGYIFAGMTSMRRDAWLVKTDSNGNKQWEKIYSGTDSDMAHSVQQTTDGGYILTGGPNSYSTQSDDAWLVKTDSNGNTQWEETFGGTGYQMAYSVQQTEDGGYILAGLSSNDDREDAWLVKTNSNGIKQWEKTFGGTGIQYTRSIQQTTDGGYIFAGMLNLFDVSRGDVWLVKVDSNGNEMWNKTFGGTDNQMPYSVQQTTDGGYIIAGCIFFSAQDNDAWLIKVKGQAGFVINEDSDFNDQEDVNALLFHTNDFKDFPSFVAKLKYSQDPLSRYLCEQLSEDTLQLLNEYNEGQLSKALQTALETELNQILQSGSLYDEQRFENIKLSEDVRKLIEDNPQGQDLVELNRLLLEEAYPQEIETHRQKEDKKIPGFTFIMLSIALILVVLTRRKSQ